MGSMIDEFIGQAKKLFSSKKTGANLIYSTTDRFHKYKLILLAITIGLVLGYTQFRDNFECHSSVKTVDKKTLTNFCWTNGTTTIDLIEEDKRDLDPAGSSLSPHIGINFRLNDGHYEVITHNYMQSLWLLLLLMALCSMIARRYWASIFDRESLVALLKLNGHEKLPQVIRVTNAKPYQSLVSLDYSQKLHNSTSIEDAQTGNRNDPIEAIRQFHNSISGDGSLNETFTKIHSENNDDDLAIIYYVNQLLHLLITTGSTTYKISGLKLKSRMIKYQLVSFAMTSLQFILPRLFIGKKYTNYGWQLAQVWLLYIRDNLITGSSSMEPNRIDYHISGRIWPTSTQCLFKQYGYQGIDSISANCTVSINEICAKLFAIIWWVITINIIIEIASLISLLVCSISYDVTRSTFGFRFWPRARREANLISNFRFQHNTLINQNYESLNQSSRARMFNSTDEDSDRSLDRIVLSVGERKRVEAGVIERDNDHESSWSSLSSATLSNCLPFLNCFNKQLKRVGNRSSPDENGFTERLQDSNMLFLLYLLHLRLNCSVKKTQLLIRMTHRALNIYLSALKDFLRKRKVGASIGPSAPRSSNRDVSRDNAIQLESQKQIQALTIVDDNNNTIDFNHATRT